MPREGRKESEMKVTNTAITLAASALVLGVSPPARAHCDTMDGPVVKAAQKALETGKPGAALAWVKPEDEATIKAAFEKTLAVRKAGGEAKALADQWFFETLVRVHRAGEGAPYTGLKPAGQDFGPAIPAADKAAATGSAEAAEKLLVETVRAGLAEKFKALKGRKMPGDNAAEGREWVEAYVPFLHYVQGVFMAAKGAGGAHVEEAEAAIEGPGHGGHGARGHEGHEKHGK